jgi:acyl dehydratase
MGELRNIPYSSIEIGQQAQFEKSISQQDLVLFAHVSGDHNPLHLDSEFAATTQFGEPIAHGMLTGAVISAALAQVLPGPGAIFVSQTLNFLRPVKPGDVVTVTLTVSAKDDRRKRLTLDCKVANQAGKNVCSGEAVVIASDEEIVINAADLPPVNIG